MTPFYHPADIIVELAGFSPDTLNHFIDLKRPESSDLPNGESFARRRGHLRRGQRRGVSLMPSAVDYETMGKFYVHLRECFVGLAADVGEMAELLLGLKIVSALQTPVRRLFPLLEEIAATFAKKTVGRTLVCGELLLMPGPASLWLTDFPVKPSAAGH